MRKGILCFLFVLSFSLPVFASDEADDTDDSTEQVTVAAEHAEPKACKKLRQSCSATEKCCVGHCYHNTCVPKTKASQEAERE
jgi:hypothetical protein